MRDRYVAQVRLLVSVLPDIAQETAFAPTAARNLGRRDHIGTIFCVLGAFEWSRLLLTERLRQAPQLVQVIENKAN